MEKHSSSEMRILKAINFWWKNRRQKIKWTHFISALVEHVSEADKFGCWKRPSRSPPLLLQIVENLGTNKDKMVKKRLSHGKYALTGH